MLISNSNNFVFIRVPKTGSTSALFYFLNSGLYDESKDNLVIEQPFISWSEMEKHFTEYPDNYIEAAMPLLRERRLLTYSDVHASYSELIGQGKASKDTPCYSVIRNPIDWLSSIYYYEKKMAHADAIKKDLNEFCYAACIKGESVSPKHAKRLQSSYFPEHAKLWNTENLHEHAVNDITALGGKVDKKIYVRKTHSTPKDYQSLISQEVIQMIELKYLKDFELWEKAYAVYN